MKRSPIRRKSPLNKINKVRRQKRFDKAFHSSGYRDWIRNQPCDNCGASPCDPSHIKTQAAGGTHECIVPHCRRCHQAFHSEGRHTFAERRGLTYEKLIERAAEYWDDYKSMM
jgi:hypothetical protein